MSIKRRFLRSPSWIRVWKQVPGMETHGKLEYSHVPEAAVEAVPTVTRVPVLQVLKSLTQIKVRPVFN
jgi:hypothetical protein